jgi:hypothetical protein
MTTQTNVEALIEAAKHLTSEDHERLLKALLEESRLLAGQRRITEIRGLGKEVWQGIDAQDYVNADRDSWI